MSKIIEEIKALATRLKSSQPAEQNDLVAGLKAAQAEAAEAEARKNSAESEEDFFKYGNAHVEAKKRVEFYKSKLDAYNRTMRMPEPEYFSHVEAVESEVQKAASKYRDTVRKAMNQIMTARREYIELASDADIALAALDESANVLQVKHRFQMFYRVGMEPEKKESPSEWKRHAIRYFSGITSSRGYDMAVMSGDDMTVHDHVLTAAWDAAAKVERHTTL